MPPTNANYIAYTAPINPSSATPILTLPQVWRGLELKIRAGQDFVGGAIKTTDVIREYRTEKTNLPVTVREILFSDPKMGRVEETCIAFEPMKVEFHQKDGSKVANVISFGNGGVEQGDLYMTYTFEWLHAELEGNEGGLREKRRMEEKMARTAVESTIEAMRGMVRDGRI